MKRTLLGFLFLPVLLLAADPKPPAQAAASMVINQLAWLAGKWRTEKAGRIVEEQWMAPAGGVMLGMSRTITRGKVVDHEFMQIREGPGGALFFIALPSGQKEAAFQVFSLSATEAVFENKQNDFPQRIIYTLRPDGSVLAAIEGPGTEGIRRVEFPYRKVGP
jgi:hypothetical protein